MLHIDAGMGNVIGTAAAIDFGIQWTCWLVSALLKTEKFYDLAGSGTFLYLAYRSLVWTKTYHPRQKIQTALIMTWAARLGMFLSTRVLKAGQDRRFDKVKGRLGLFWIYWTVQGIWVLTTLLPTLILNDKGQDHPLCTRDYIGWGLWLIGFVLEVVADYQKSAFRANPHNAHSFINNGLWSISQHPNYFGEILLWTGLYISATSVMTKGYEYASVISPIFVAFLLTRVSGIPILEKQAIKTWGDNPMYKEYVKKTAKLIPFIW